MWLRSRQPIDFNKKIKPFENAVQRLFCVITQQAKPSALIVVSRQARAGFVGAIAAFKMPRSAKQEVQTVAARVHKMRAHINHIRRVVLRDAPCFKVKVKPRNPSSARICGWIGAQCHDLSDQINRWIDCGPRHALTYIHVWNDRPDMGSTSPWPLTGTCGA